MAPDRQQLFPGKVFISTALDALETKTVLSGSQTRRYLQRAIMAGVIIGAFYVAYFEVLAAFDSVKLASGSTLLPIGRLVAALVFGWALVFIYYTRSELLTSNMMIVSVGRYHRRVYLWGAAKLLGWCYLGNFIGGVIIAVGLKLSTLPSDPARQLMYQAVDHKLSYLSDGWAGTSDLFVRAIFCNLMINLAMLLVYNGLIKDDFTKSMTMVMAVFLFAFNGFEHSVADTVLFMIVGLQQGVDVLGALASLAIVLVGNFIGGGLLIGMYFAYVNDDRDFEAEGAEPAKD